MKWIRRFKFWLVGDYFRHPPWREFIMCFKSRMIERFICRRKGHDFIDYSTAGPDTGNIDLYCKRCHRDFYQVLY